MLQAKNLSLSIAGKMLIKDVSLDVKKGEVVALIGPNGAGKTCMLKMLSGDMKPDSGQITLMGKPLANYPVKSLALQRSVMPQSSALNFPFSVAQVVMFGRNPHINRAGETRDDHAIVSEALADTEMEAFKDRNYLTLSGGEKARVNLARVLAQRAPLILLDEPISHVDPRHQHRILAIARSLAKGGAGVLVVLHDLNIAATYADRIGIMHLGKLRAIGTPNQVLSEDLLREVFQIGFLKIQHPQQNHPIMVIIPLW